jgi:hypothetical protein
LEAARGAFYRATPQSIVAFREQEGYLIRGDPASCPSRCQRPVHVRWRDVDVLWLGDGARPFVQESAAQRFESA